MTMSEVHAPAVEYALGRRLKARREELNLTIHDVSAQMHLEPRVIEALESDDYSSLPAPLYVRGYLRGYAKVLKIDADSLLEQFESGHVPDTPEIVPEAKHPTQASSSDKPVRFLTYFITLTLVILVVIWWQSKFVVHHKAEVPPAMRTQMQSSKNNAPGHPNNIVHQPNVTPNGAPRQEQAPAPAGFTAAAAGARTAGITPSGSAPASPAGAGSGTSTGAPAATGNAAPKTTAGTGAVAAAAQPNEHVTTAGPGGPDHIVIHVIADSWIEIFDANETRIYRNLARAGDVLKLSGTAPFSVLLGFSQGVTIEFNGKPFNPAPYSRSGVARFTLRNP